MPRQDEGGSVTKIAYVTLDVFTDRRFGGNQLAVFPDGGGLAPATMQAIAREMNLSETAFLSPAAAPQTWDLRIFTPAMELPFAGHPTIGAAVALGLLGRVTGEGIVLNEGVGPVPVRVSAADQSRGSAVLTTPLLPRRVEAATPPAPLLAETIGLREEDLGPVPPSAHSAGVPFTFMSVRDRARLDAAALDVQGWRTHLSETSAPHVVLFTLDDWHTGRDVSLRMFAPAMGIAEDPATGAAAAALASLLADLQRPADGTSCWRISQGVKMGRPSEIRLETDVASGALTAVRIGGSAVLMARATLELDGNGD